MDPQNYKIYVNDVPVFLLTDAEAALPPFEPDKKSFRAPYLGKKKQIKQFLDLLDKNTGVQRVVLHYPDVQQLWADFQDCFRPLEAAGGIVLDAQGQLLVFFRRQSWDLPKGKIDPGETPEQAALREVWEETGLQQLQLGPPAGITYHTYPLKDKRILKKTWWFHMTAGDTQTHPQTEEDIEEIRWVDPPAWLHANPTLYNSLRDLLTQIFV